jgi:Gas vesicle synthesis protein GvpL/GvpF
VAQLTGLRGKPVVSVLEGNLTAWATDIDTLEWTREDLLTHHAIVERIFSVADACLPARFGAQVTPELLAERQADLVSALERVAGRAELAVTAVWSTPGEHARTGTAYLRARAAALKQAEQLAHQLERATQDDVVEVQHVLCPSRTVMLRSALLVPGERAATAKQRLPREARDVRILVNGPWPPYTFAAVGGSAREA